MRIYQMKKILFFAVFLVFNTSIAISNTLSNEDIKWLNRISYGINSQIVEVYKTQGRKNFLAEQLSVRVNDKLPDYVNDLLDKQIISQKSAEILAGEAVKEFHRISQLPIEERPNANNNHNKFAETLLKEAIERHLLRAMYSPAQLKEQLTWFWLNHFSVFRSKGLIRWLIADYEESAIRPHVLGKFRDLLMATIRHPAMLIYLDNRFNEVGKINENYARELMELHTLGINGGYTQQDVQELARILTGVGINFSGQYPKIKKEYEQYYRRDSNFEFDPNRHDFGEKTFLGKKITGNGLTEIEQVVDILVRHPATAQFVSRQLAIYFVSDTPSPDLIQRVAETFQSSDGDISATLHTLLESKEFTESLGKKISDPMHYVLAILRFSYDGQQLTDMSKPINWLQALDEPLYGHTTPDGYGLTEKDWVSPAQLTKRFEIVKAIINNNLTSNNELTLKNQKLSYIHIFQLIKPLLSTQTKLALEKAISVQEWNSFLLSSPEFVNR